MWSIRSKGTISPLYWIGSLALIAIGDYLTGPFIHSAVLFYLIPVALAAWGSRSRWPAVAAALVWPALRLEIVALWGWPWPKGITLQDAVVNVILSLAFATIVWQLRRQGLAIRTLEGLLPMCGFCKRIRTDSGWERVDVYLLDHSDAMVSHTFCPECGRIHYGHLADALPTPGPAEKSPPRTSTSTGGS
ncbi:MAG TPA: hypothetical protein VHL81_00605 [Gemmatimonadales bacterium]|nr:hypothetical protein [Gemmatimonadales bacterium]